MRADPEPTRRRPRRVTEVALAVLLVAAVVYNVAVWSDKHQSSAMLHASQLQLKAASDTLLKLAAQVTTTEGVRDARRQAQARTMAEITAAQESLRTATVVNGNQSVDIAALRACLAGVSRAVSALQSSDLPGAVQSIDGASSTCLALDSSTGPAYPFNFPDPSVLTVGNQDYAFATNSAAGNIQVIQSPDLSHWTTLGDALPHLAMWAQPNNIWAPSVIRLGNSYVLYYSADFAATQEQCLSVAVATQPQGPYLDSTTWPIECQLDMGGSLDPSPFVDTNGTPYLTWKSQGTGSQPPAIWSQQLTPDGTALVAGAPSVLLTASQPWQGGIVEGPNMAVSGGQYRLFYSANSWRTADYAIGVANCSGPLGPCTESSDKPLLASQATFTGPGGPATFTDVQGTLWLAFHAWLPGAVGYPNSRLLFLRLVTVTASGAVIGP